MTSALKAIAPAFLVSIVRHVLIFAFAKFGFSLVETEMDQAAAWAAGILAIIAVAVWSAIEKRIAKQATPDGAAEITAPSGTRTIVRTLLLGGLGLALACGQVGCAGSKSSGQAYQQAVSVYSAAVTATVTASRTGQIPVDDYLAWEDNVRKPVSTMLDEWAAALIAKKPYAGLEALNALLDTMVVENLKRQKAKDTSDASQHSHGDHDRAGRGQGRFRDLRHDQAGQRRAA